MPFKTLLKSLFVEMTVVALLESITRHIESTDRYRGLRLRYYKQR
jgi:hypothetical protein